MKIGRFFAAVRQFAQNVVKKIVLAWDPDYTKLTPAEAAALADSVKNYEKGEYYTEDQINWD